jgi:hypothetical protein
LQGLDSRFRGNDRDLRRPAPMGVGKECAIFLPVAAIFLDSNLTPLYHRVNARKEVIHVDRK